MPWVHSPFVAAAASAKRPPAAIRPIEGSPHRRAAGMRPARPHACLLRALFYTPSKHAGRLDVSSVALSPARAPLQVQAATVQSSPPPSQCSVESNVDYNGADLSIANGQSAASGAWHHVTSGALG